MREVLVFCLLWLGADRVGIENGLSKQLYLRMFPEISSASHVIEVKNMIEPVGVGPQNSIEREGMKTDHKNYVSISAYFRRGLPIYSAKAVRFRMGHPRSPIGIGSDSRDEFEAGHENSAFIWTYTSPQFPMAQENRLQKFKLPEPLFA
ncbi:hypothetical protein Vadar_007530 [Vaccinium darrowii]|uniref:Uncharacterized protein n=1 Tax=Vaccinium darrowii TaxID=229202 RepID=A0ACB7ZII4_9ERIC|nr:hypothetical protein Vadar_007530 [Vaccinium darrowii]